MKMAPTLLTNIKNTLANKDLDGFAVRLDDSLGFFVAFLPHCKAARALVENPLVLYSYIAIYSYTNSTTKQKPCKTFAELKRGRSLNSDQIRNIQGQRSD